MGMGYYFIQGSRGSSHWLGAFESPEWGLGMGMPESFGRVGGGVDLSPFTQIHSWEVGCKLSSILSILSKLLITFFP